MVEVLVTGGAGFIGSNFVRYALAHASGLARHHARQAHLRRTPREPARRDGPPAARVRAGRHRRRGRQRPAGRAIRARRALRGRDARRPVDPGGGRLHPHRRRGHVRAARGGAARDAAPPVRPDFDRRGLRQRRDRRQPRDRRAQAAQSVFGEQGGRGSAGLQLLGDLRRAGRHHAGVEQLRPVPVSRRRSFRCSSPTRSTTSPCRSTATAGTSATGCTCDDHCRAHRPADRARRRRRGLQHRRRQRRDERRFDDSASSARSASRCRSSSRSPIAPGTTAGTASTRRSCARSDGRRRCRSTQGLRDTVDWYRGNDWWWRPIKEQDPAFRSYYQAQYERRT